uniref:Theg spermatid protein n=1 Tax=Rousettus aegyptiacus TaxID=9407 RepID=A0A7J8BV98_ROUAE|nr:theg spermatid protein [Rousettus aegyptiacus]
MGDPEQSLLYDQRDPEAEGRLETGQDSDGLGLPSAGYESLPSGGSAYQDLGDGKLGFEDQEEETLPEEVAGDEFLDAQDPGEAVPELERVLRRDEEDEAPETRLSVSITPRLPRSLGARGRKAGRRLLELAKPKTTWQVLRDRTRCRCAGHAWVSPRLWTLQFCVYWPSVYWTDRFLEDTTLTVTVPGPTLSGPSLGPPWSTTPPAACGSWPPRKSGTTSGAPTCLRCPRCPRQPRWPSPARGSSSWQSPERQPPCWQSGTPCRNPSDTCPTTAGSFTWPCPRPSQRSVFLTETHAGRCWMSPRRQWPAPGSSPWPSPRSAGTPMRATTPTTSRRPP